MPSPDATVARPRQSPWEGHQVVDEDVVRRDCIPFFPVAPGCLCVGLFTFEGLRSLGAPGKHQF